MRIEEKCLMRFIFLQIILCFSVLVAACGNDKNNFDASLLDAQKPFGQSWGNSDFDTEQSDTICEIYLGKLDEFFTPAESTRARKMCLAEQHITQFIPQDDLPTSLRQGEVGVTSKGGIEPVWFTYSYLHDWTGENAEKKTNLRKAHAQMLRRQLQKLYGVPAASGYFDQGSKLGFVIDASPEQPCDFWIQQNIGIMLCSERVVMVDGTEMSLSFVDLNKTPIGKGIRDMLLPSSSKDTEPITLPQSAEISTNPSMFETLHELSELVNLERLKKCKSDDLSPIEDVGTLPDDKKIKIIQKFEIYEGEELSNAAIENYSTQIEESSDDHLEETLIFLLLQAADQGSPSAMNELGVLLLYCDFGVQQDIDKAYELLTIAVNSGDGNANYNLAGMNLLGLTNSTSPQLEAKELLEQCSKATGSLGEDCTKRLMAFETLTVP